VTFDSLIAEDDATRRVIEEARRAARSDASVLLVGESGTGKNLFAQAIHNTSPRAEKPFVSASCASFAESVLESELFGHEKGAFTGADRTKKGVFELADGGTLFLDEIGELSKNAQAKILRAVEYKEFERVGGEETLRSDIRILFATNRDLAAAVRNEEFREDLFYRVNEIRIEIPPLRKRKKDIPRLAERYLDECNATFGYKIDGFEEDAERALLAFDWPGNARRLRAVVKRACAITDSKRITVDDLDLTELTSRQGPAPDTNIDLTDWTLAVVERRHIEMVLAHTKGNKSEAARILGIARTTLDRKLAGYGIG
jgi:two-component system NtrC family response regulator/two-component system response regulator HydG